MVAAGSRAGNSKGGVTAANVAQQQQQQTGATDGTSSRAGSSQAAVQVTGAVQQQQTGATDGTSRRAGSSQAAVQVTSAVQQQEQQQTGATDGTGSRASSNKAVVRDTTAVRQQQSVLQGATGSRAGSSMASVSGRQLAPAGPQDRMLAKLGLGRKPSHTLQASSQPSQASATAAPSGQSHSPRCSMFVQNIGMYDTGVFQPFILGTPASPWDVGYALCLYTVCTGDCTMYAVNATSKGSVGDVRHGCMQFRNPSQVFDN